MKDKERFLDREWLAAHGKEYWKDIVFSPGKGNLCRDNQALIAKFAADCQKATGDALDIGEIEDHAWDVLSGETSWVEFRKGGSSKGYISAEGTLNGCRTLVGSTKNTPSHKEFIIGVASGHEPEDLKGNLSPEEFGVVIYWLSHPVVNPLDCHFWEKISPGVKSPECQCHDAEQKATK